MFKLGHCLLLLSIFLGSSAYADNLRALPINALAPETTFVSNTDFYYPATAAYFQFGRHVANNAVNFRQPYCRIETATQNRKVYFRKGDKFSLKNAYGSFSVQTIAMGRTYNDRTGELQFDDYRLEIWCDFEDKNQLADMTLGELSATLGPLFSIEVIPVARPIMPAGPTVNHLMWKYLTFGVRVSAAQYETRYIQDGAFTTQPSPNAPYCYFERPDGKAFAVEKGAKLGVIGVLGSYATPPFLNQTYETWLLFNIGPSDWNYSLRLVCRASTPYYRLTIPELRKVLGAMVEIP